MMPFCWIRMPQLLFFFSGDPHGIFLPIKHVSDSWIDVKQ